MDKLTISDNQPWEEEFEEGVPDGDDLAAAVQMESASGGANPGICDPGQLQVDTERDEEPKHPLDILPIEMWDPILKFLSDPRDKLNAINTCTFFGVLIEDQMESLRVAEILPLVAPWLGKRDLITCRKVAKNVQQRVDQILDEVEIMSPFKNRNLFPRLTPPASSSSTSLDWSRYHCHRLGCQMLIYSTEQLGKFHRAMQKTSLVSPRGRPCVGKWLKLILRNAVDPGVPNWDELPCINVDLLEKSTEILTQYQHKIRHLHFDSFYRRRDLIETYSTVRTLLLTLPNLRSITGEFIPWPPCDQFEASKIAELQAYIELNPLPRMDFLEDLTFRPEGHMSTPFYQEIVRRYGGTLKKLHLHSHPASSSGMNMCPEYISGNPQQLPDLVDLALGFTWNRRDILLKMETPCLVSLELYLAVEGYDFPPIPPSQLAQLILHFPNLVHLQLMLKYCGDYSPEDNKFEVGPPKNCHRNLKHLTIIESLSLQNFRLAFFAKLFPSLETLHINSHGCHDWRLFFNSYPDIDLHLLTANRMYDSTLWAKLPNLQSIRFTRMVETMIAFHSHMINRTVHYTRQEGLR